MRRIRLLLADDHRMFLAGLQKLLEPEFDVVGAVADGRMLVAMAGKLKPDVIVADISMPSLNGIEAAQQLKAKGLQYKLIFLTMHADPLFVQEALRCGASGYVLKRDAPDELVVAIRKVYRGKSYFTPDLPITGSVAAAEGMLGKLTARQREVFQLAAEGRTLKEIAAAIHVSVKTAEFHKYNLMQRLGARTSADLTALAIKHGMILA
jgi:DNA-binding NarL/FixJ family response regulator